MPTFNVNNSDITQEDTVGLDDVIEASGITKKENMKEDAPAENLSTATSGYIAVADALNEDNDEDDDYVPVSVDSTPKISAEASHAKYNDILNSKLKYLSEIDTGKFGQTKERILSEIDAYKKNLITKRGFTPEEAEEAALNRVNKIADDESSKFEKENPRAVVIQVAKGDADKIEFDPADKIKIHKAQAIRLVEVEEEELKHINIKKITKKTAFNQINLNTCTLAKYSIPCINTGDMCTFAGTSSYSLVQLFYDETETTAQKMLKQIALVYDKFISSTTKNKYNAVGDLIMTQEDFANWFNFADLSAALYAIYVASSTEMLTSPFECINDACLDVGEDGKNTRHSYNYTYNVKELADFSSLDDEENKLYKTIFEHINKAANDAAAMKKMQDKLITGHRYKSSVTNNIYDIQSPTCARAVEFQKLVKPGNDQPAQMSQLYANIAMYMNCAYVYCGEEDGEPVYMEPIEDPQALYELVENAIEPEFQLFWKKLVVDKSYIYEFKIKTQCDKCGTVDERPVDVSYLIFQKAQGTEAEIE